MRLAVFGVGTFSFSSGSLNVSRELTEDREVSEERRRDGSAVDVDARR